MAKPTDQLCPIPNCAAAPTVWFQAGHSGGYRMFFGCIKCSLAIIGPSGNWAEALLDKSKGADKDKKKELAEMKATWNAIPRVGAHIGTVLRLGGRAHIMLPSARTAPPEEGARIKHSIFGRGFISHYVYRGKHIFAVACQFDLHDGVKELVWSFCASKIRDLTKRGWSKVPTPNMGVKVMHPWYGVGEVVGSSQGSDGAFIEVCFGERRHSVKSMSRRFVWPTKALKGYLPTAKRA